MGESFEIRDSTLFASEMTTLLRERHKGTISALGDLMES